MSAPKTIFLTRAGLGLLKTHPKLSFAAFSLGAIAVSASLFWRLYASGLTYDVYYGHEFAFEENYRASWRLAAALVPAAFTVTVLAWLITAIRKRRGHLRVGEKVPLPLNAARP